MINPYSWYYHIKSKYGEGYRYINGDSLLDDDYGLPEDSYWTLMEENPLPRNMVNIHTLPIKSDLSE